MTDDLDDLTDEERDRREAVVDVAGRQRRDGMIGRGLDSFAVGFQAGPVAALRLARAL
jgi:hypothetical protein